jgi:hypothetical protein
MSTGAQVSTRATDMRVRVAMRLLLAVAMNFTRQFDRNHDDTAVPHATLGNHLVGAFLNVRCPPLENRDLHAAVVVEMDVQRRLRQIVMMMHRADQAFCEVASRMVVDVDDGGNTMLAAQRVLRGLLDSGSGQIPDGLRSVLISTRLDDAVEIGHEVVVDCDRDALHKGALLMVLASDRCA